MRAADLESTSGKSGIIELDKGEVEYGYKSRKVV